MKVNSVSAIILFQITSNSSVTRWLLKSSACASLSYNYFVSCSYLSSEVDNKRSGFPCNQCSSKSTLWRGINKVLFLFKCNLQKANLLITEHNLDNFVYFSFIYFETCACGKANNPLHMVKHHRRAMRYQNIIVKDVNRWRTRHVEWVLLKFITLLSRGKSNCHDSYGVKQPFNESDMNMILHKVNQLTKSCL